VRSFFIILKEVSETEYRAALKGHEILMRHPVPDDAEKMIEGRKLVCDETDYLGRYGDEVKMTTEEERKYIEDMTSSKSNISVVVFCDGEYIGDCSVTGGTCDRLKHRGTLGIALRLKYTGLGIGTLLMENILNEAKECGFEQIELKVATKNERALALYKKFGFQICGTLPHHMKYRDGTYADMYYMVKML